MSEQSEKKAFDGLIDADLIQVEDDSEAGSDDGEEKQQQLAVSERLEPIDSPPIQSWLIKIPAELQSRWSKIKEPGIHLGKLRVYNPTESHPNREFVLLVPEDPSNPTSGPSSKGASPMPAASGSKAQATPLDVKPEEAPMLEYILSESAQAGNLARQKFLYQEDRRRYEFNGTSKRPGNPRLVGAVQKQCNLVPNLSNRKMAELIKQQYAIPDGQRRKTRLLTDEALTAGQRNSLATGNSLMRHKQSLKATLAYQTVKRVDPRSLKERSYRMGKQTLIDTLFEEFSRFKYWSMRALKDRLRQPEAWLKECLSEVAQQEQEGPYKSLWTLKPQFAAVQGEADEGHMQAPDNQELSDSARRALELGENDDGNGNEQKPKRQNGGSEAGDDAELMELEGDEDEDMEEVKV